MRRVLATCVAIAALGAVAIAPSAASAGPTQGAQACESSKGNAARCPGKNLLRGGKACLASKGKAARCPGLPQ
jgi:hypothetical protein